MNTELVVGIDIGGTNTAFGIVDKKGNVLERGSISTKNQDDIHVYVESLHQHLLPLFEKVEGKIKGIGVGAPNGNFYTGNIEFAPNLPWKRVIPLQKLIEDQFDLPVKLTNDANAAALGEMFYGAAKGMKNFVVVTLGTGLGSGIVINGQLVYGHDGFAGEMGHITVKKGGRQCGCGRKGCLETYVSATGIVRTMLGLFKDTNIDSELRNIKTDELSSKDIAIAASRGDQLALEAIDYTAEILGEALSNYVALAAPEAIILFGGMAKAGDLLLKPTEKYMNNNLLTIWKDKIKILQSEVNEDDAAILGASGLAWDSENLQTERGPLQ